MIDLAEDPLPLSPELQVTRIRSRSDTIDNQTHAHSPGDRTHQRLKYTLPSLVEHEDVHLNINRILRPIEGALESREKLIATAKDLQPTEAL
jgi:hypothetical protein